MANPTSETLIYRFLNKETSETENGEILEWVSASEENRKEFENVHRIFHVNKLPQYRSEIDIDRAWENLLRQVPHQKKTKNVFSLRTLQQFAASVLVILAFGFGSLWTFDHFLASQKSMIVQFDVPAGEKSKITLPDGSLVWLNSQTVLKYDALHPREVNMQGEAYFEIEKDRKHPFIISSPAGMKVRVTGTKFNFRNYATEKFVETSLEEGEVFITDKNSKQLALLKPGQQAKYFKETGLVQVQNVIAENFSIWRNSELRLSEISFAELVPKIERWFGVSVNINQMNDNNDRFTLTVKTESLRELLNMMQLTSKFDYEINGSQVSIHLK